MAETIDVRLRKTGLKPTHVATDLGFQQTAVRRYFNGDNPPSISFLQAFAEKYNVSLIWLITGEDSNKIDILNSEERQLLEIYRKANISIRSAAIAVLASSVGGANTKGNNIVGKNIVAGTNNKVNYGVGENGKRGKSKR